MQFLKYGKHSTWENVWLFYTSWLFRFYFSYHQWEAFSNTFNRPLRISDLCSILFIHKIKQKDINILIKLSNSRSYKVKLVMSCQSCQVISVTSTSHVKSRQVCMWNQVNYVKLYQSFCIHVRQAKPRQSRNVIWSHVMSRQVTSIVLSHISHVKSRQSNHVTQ